MVESEARLLVDHGAEVQLLESNNDAIVGFIGKLQASKFVFYNSGASTLLRQQIATFKPNIVHVHNWFPTLSPAIFRVCKQLSTPVIHTVHNYRLLCIKGSLYRNGKPCEDCLNTAFRSSGVIHACYRESRLGSAAATAGMLTHWRAGTWEKIVDQYIALSEFARKKLIEGGLPAQKITVKPNSLDYDPPVGNGGGRYFAYIGRLTEEKGLRTLLHCWKNNASLPELKIVGTGPLEAEIQQVANSITNVTYLGGRSSHEVLAILSSATALICPSLWYEGMPRVVIEAMAVGTPVIASRLGTYVEMIDHGVYGGLFTPNDSEDLYACLRGFMDRGLFAKMRVETRRQFDLKYGVQNNIHRLLDIYKTTINSYPYK